MREAKFIQLLAELLKFTFTVVYAEDGQAGELSADGKWTGLIGMLHEGQCDMAIEDIGITMERSKVVQFSYPYYNADVTFLTNKPEPLPKNWVIFHPFSDQVWQACITVFLLISMLFCAIYLKKLCFVETV